MHGDDFTTAGPNNQLDWFEQSLAKVYEMTRGGRLGPGRDDDRETTVLNRVVRWTGVGLEYEADPRQVERLLIEVELDGEKANGAPTPGTKPLAHQITQEQELPQNNRRRTGHGQQEQTTSPQTASTRCSQRRRCFALTTRTHHTLVYIATQTTPAVFAHASQPRGGAWSWGSTRSKHGLRRRPV